MGSRDRRRAARGRIDRLVLAERTADVRAGDAMNAVPRVVGDLAHLPTYAFGTRSLTWWGVVGFVAIEGIAIALACGTYLYLLSQEAQWPPPPAPLPPLQFASAFTLLLLASEVLNT